MQFLPSFSNMTKIASFGEKILMPVENKDMSVIFIFSDLSWVKYNCENFHYCWICVTFRSGGRLTPHP